MEPGNEIQDALTNSVILECIFAHLSARDLMNSRLVNREWLDIATYIMRKKSCVAAPMHRLVLMMLEEKDTDHVVDSIISSDTYPGNLHYWNFATITTAIDRKVDPDDNLKECGTMFRCTSSAYRQAEEKRKDEWKTEMDKINVLSKKVATKAKITGLILGIVPKNRYESWCVRNRLYKNVLRRVATDYRAVTDYREVRQNTT